MWTTNKSTMKENMFKLDQMIFEDVSKIKKKKTLKIIIYHNNIRVIDSLI